MVSIMEKIELIGKTKINNIYYHCRNFTGSKKIFKFDELFEYPYYSKIILNIKELLKDNFEIYDFLIYSKIAQKVLVDDSEYIPSNKQDNLILFYISDETGHIPLEFAKKCKIVFKVLIKENSIDNIHYFPLGYANGDELPIIPIQNRKYNVFFMGQLGRNRMSLFKTFSHTNWIPTDILLLLKQLLPKDFSSTFPKSIIKFTTGFGSGLNRDEYNKVLYNSKIVICPYGAVTPETFRHYEAMRAGCVIITLKMPEVFPFQNAPIIQLNNWDELVPTIKSLLEDQSKLENFHAATLDWWRTKCSEDAVARYVIEKL